MKIIQFLIIACSIALITSCTSDDMTPIDTNAQASNLVGEWNLTEESQEGTGTVTLNDVTLNGPITSFAKDIDASLTVSESPNILTAAGSYTEVITGSFAAFSRTEEVPIILNNELSQGAWSLNKGVITLSDGNETQEVNIIELTSTTLKIEIPIERDVILEGTTVALDTTIKMTFVKQ